jgi:16S rRNA processing protein RimM
MIEGGVVSGHQPPSDLIDLGIVYDAQGLKGHIKVRPYSPDPVALLACKEAYFQSPHSATFPSIHRVHSAKIHSGYVVMLLDGICDRDAALALKGQTVLLPRKIFPAPEQDAYYWIDLIGCEVYNEQGIRLGNIEDMAEFGADPIMTIGSELIPFVPAIVKSVQLKSAELPSGRVVVDWQPNWSQ